MPFFEICRDIPVRSHVWKIDSGWLSLSRVIVSTNIFPRGTNPLLGGGGLHLTFDAHFRTRMSYSSQKSCIKIWFGLAEIGGMLMSRGTEDPLLGGLHVTCDAHFRTWPSFSRYKSCVKIWFGLIEVFKSYRGNKKKKKKKKKKDHRRSSI